MQLHSGRWPGPPAQVVVWGEAHSSCSPFQGKQERSVPGAQQGIRNVVPYSVSWEVRYRDEMGML